VLALSSVVTLASAEINHLSEQWPLIKKKSEQFLEKAQDLLQTNFSLTYEEQNQIIQGQTKNFQEMLKNVGKSFVLGTVEFVSSFVMVLVFTFLFLLQKEKYKNFILRIFASADKKELETVIGKISTVSAKYLLGMIYSILIITTLYSTGFLIIGLKNAILLAFIASIFILVPYIGAWIGGLIPFTVALVTGDTLNTALGVAAVMVVVQTIDNNIIEPYVVGGEVRLSAAATVLSLIVGGTVWGIAGVVLFVPLIGILKIMFDHIEPLKPYGYLIGDPQKAPSKVLYNLYNKITAKFR
jgi:predicted PurR-regulated permease PerM